MKEVMRLDQELGLYEDDLMLSPNILTGTAPHHPIYNRLEMISFAKFCVESEFMLEDYEDMLNEWEDEI